MKLCAMQDSSNSKSPGSIPFGNDENVAKFSMLTNAFNCFNVSFDTHALGTV